MGPSDQTVGDKRGGGHQKIRIGERYKGKRARETSKKKRHHPSSFWIVMDLCYKSWGPVVRSLTPRLSPQFLRGTSGSATKIGGHTAPRLRPERLSVTLGLTPSTFQADQGLNTENHQRSPNLSGSSPSGHSLHHHFQLHPHRPRSISGVPALYKIFRPFINLIFHSL